MKKNSIFRSEVAKMRTLIATIGVATMFFLCSLFDGTPTAAKEPVAVNAKSKMDYVAKLSRIYTDSINTYDMKLDSIETLLVSEVDEYIHSVSKNSKMTGEYIVRRCIENDYDIPLLMAQAHQETHFAKFGGRNNVFGIVGKRYSHPDKAVDDYIKLMKKRYIINRTPEELIKSGFRCENGRGYYAEANNYSAAIGKLRNKIINNTEIYNLWLEYKSLIMNQQTIRFRLDELKRDSMMIMSLS